MEIGRQINQGAGSIYNENIISNHLYYSADYQKLVSEINDTKEILDSLPESKTELRLKHSGKLNDLEKQLTDFKQNVFSLYETFTKIPINTDRLRLAKAHFDKGEFREADAILKAEEISKEVNDLKSAKLKKESELEEIEIHLENKANEFLIKAQLWTTFYSEPDWFERTVDFYEKALDAARNVEIVTEYAAFLYKHNKFNQAQPLHEEALKIYRELARENPQTYLPDVAMTLNNLANLHADKNEFPQVSGNYEEALHIYRALARENPQAYLPFVATIAINLSIFYLQSFPDKENSIALAIESLEIAKQFTEHYQMQQATQLAIRVLQAHGVDLNELIKIE